jgi:hypothetical protein
VVLGGFITVTGIFNPFLIAGPAIAAVAGGLLYMLDVGTSTGQWIGYQILLGIGVGACLTIPLMLAGIVVKPKDVSTATAVMICKFLRLLGEIPWTIAEFASRPIHWRGSYASRSSGYLSERAS